MKNGSVSVARSEIGLWTTEPPGCSRRADSAGFCDCRCNRRRGSFHCPLTLEQLLSLSPAPPCLNPVHTVFYIMRTAVHTLLAFTHICCSGFLIIILNSHIPLQELPGPPVYSAIPLLLNIELFPMFTANVAISIFLQTAFPLLLNYFLRVNSQGQWA